jgi:hypothetical protein
VLQFVSNSPYKITTLQAIRTPAKMLLPMKVKFALEQAMKAQKGGGGIAPLFL